MSTYFATFSGTFQSTEFATDIAAHSPTVWCSFFDTINPSINATKQLSHFAT